MHNSAQTIQIPSTPLYCNVLCSRAVLPHNKVPLITAMVAFPSLHIYKTALKMDRGSRDATRDRLLQDVILAD